MRLNGYRHLGGLHADTTALRNVLTYLDVRAPHTGEPFSEALLFGLGGGIGAAYWCFEYEGTPPMVWIGPRYFTGTARDPSFIELIGHRLGLPVDVHQTTGPATAEKRLRGVLAQGRPAIAAVDLGTLAYLACRPEFTRCFYHNVVVFGLDAVAGRADVGDLAATPFTLTPDELAAARAGVQAERHKLYAVGAPVGPIDLHAGITAALADTLRGLTDPARTNCGLPALLKWADLTVNTRDRKGWRRVFPPGAPLYRALTLVHCYIDRFGSGGGAFRPLYAAFLDEAATVCGEPALRTAAEAYRVAATRWTALAEAALPDAAPTLAETKALTNRLDRLFLDHGPDGLAEMRLISERLDALAATVAEAFPLDAAGVDALLADLHAHILSVHRAEVDAAAALRAAYVTIARQFAVPVG